MVAICQGTLPVDRLMASLEIAGRGAVVAEVHLGPRVGAAEPSSEKF